jgi:hypothetical protein
MGQLTLSVLSGTDHVVGWDEGRVRALASDIAKRKRGLFAGLPEFSRDDLISEVVQAARENWHKLDCFKSAASTFIYTIGQRRLISLQRTAWRNRKRERAVSDRRPEDYLPPELLTQEIPTDMPLAEWLRAVCLAARRVFGTMRAGQHFYSRDKLIGIAALAARKNLSVRGCRMMISQQPDIRHALHLTDIPSVTAIHFAITFLKRHVETASPTQKRAEVETPFRDRN